MDEFNKIQELSENIVGRKEPTFGEDSDDATNYHVEAELEKLPSLDTFTEKETDFKWRFGIIGFIGLIIVAIIGGVIISGSNGGDEPIPVIEPSPDPVRVKPENPGGMVIPDQDKMIYNRLTQKTETAKVEKLFPEPEKPVLPEILIKQNTPDPTFIEPENILAVNPLAPETSQSEGVEETSTAESTETLNLPEKIEEEPKPISEKTIPLKPKAEKTPVAQKAQESEIWRVQLFSTSKKAVAEKAWIDISKKQKALLSDMSHDVVSVNIAGKGTFYRLQAGRFTSKEMATGLCKKLKAKKQDCIPVKYGK